MTKDQIESVLESVRSWPVQDQEELAQVAREIEARRKGIYVMTEDERRAVEEAELSPLATDDEVAALWKALGIT